MAETDVRAVWGRVCGCSLAGIAGLNPSRCIDVCLVWLLHVVKHRSLSEADPLSREILPNVVYHNVWSTILKNEAALARVGLLR
jgi:hypothetical protein